jgi:Rieske Fe-S protein
LLQKTPLPDPETLAPGEACIGERDGRSVALSRDEEGKVHAVSARCSHLGGELRFNEMEKTWDCACHGSRFTREGKVLCGPALRDLEKLDSAERKEAQPEEAA